MKRLKGKKRTQASMTKVKSSSSWRFMVISPSSDMKGVENKKGGKLEKCLNGIHCFWRVTDPNYCFTVRQFTLSF